jgi:metallo-beta-lactamase family protein
MTRPATLTFAGGAGTVTGSKHLIRAEGKPFLLDCGLFQGLKALRLLNWADPPFDPRELGSVVLSHGHLDHSGYLPLLARRGFRGPIYCTSATADLIAYVLRDSAHLQEEDADRANRYHYSRHHPAEPLYTLDDAEMALSLIETRPYGHRFDVESSGARALFHRAGHILGSAIVDVELAGAARTRIVFSGDLGRWDRPILHDPDLVEDADVLLVESTYGDRTHPADSEQQLVDIIKRTTGRGGAIVVPAFAIGRTQELLWILRKLTIEKRLPLLSVYVDSPMAANVTEIYARHSEEQDDDMKRLIASSGNPLVPGDGVHFVRSVEDSKALNGRTGPLFIITASGMATGGRVLHHLKRRLPDHRNTVLLVGYQADGTRGRRMQDGERTVRIHGEDVEVRAEIATIDGLSAHADQSEIMRWLRGFRKPPRNTYLVHGEPRAATALERVVEDELGWNVDVAQAGQVVEL